MLNERRPHTTIPAADIDRAVRWYEEKLGWKPRRRSPSGVSYGTPEDIRFVIYPSPNAGQAPQTVMGFRTADIPMMLAPSRFLRTRGTDRRLNKAGHNAPLRTRRGAQLRSAPKPYE